MATGFTVLAGYDVEKKHQVLKSRPSYTNSNRICKASCFPHDFVSLSEIVGNPAMMIDEGAEASRVTEIMTDTSKMKRRIISKIQCLDSGVNQLLFTLGVPMDIETLLQPAKDGKTPVNVFYLKSLGSEHLQSFLQELGDEYDWMLKQKAAEGETNCSF